MIKPTRTSVILAVALLTGVASTVRAEEKELVASLTLEQLVSTTLQENPQLHSMRAKWEAMQERPVQQTTLPNPMFAYRAMDAVNDYSFPNTEEKRLEIEQPFPWFGKLGLRGKIATKDAEAMGREYEAMQREVIMMAKESYFDLYAVQRSLSITRAEEDVLKRMEEIAETKYSTGEVSQQDVLKAQAELSMLQQRLLELGAQENTIKAKINVLLNRNADAPVGLAVTAPAIEFDATREELFKRAEKARPEIKQAQAQLERSQYERRLMTKEFFPDYRLGVEYRTFRSSEDMVMFTVGFDLPIWLSKNRAGVREAEKMIESGKAALEAAQRNTSFDVQDAHFKSLTAKRTVDLYKTALVPQAEMRFEASEAGYRTGKVDFLDLLESERFLLSARVMLAMAEGNLGMQLARLERAVGTDLKPAPQPEGEKK
jgi:cobalt-zinc-cadmium efflux system outer membrane protein